MKKAITLVVRREFIFTLLGTTATQPPCQRWRCRDRFIQGMKQSVAANVPLENANSALDARTF
ncbi:hypothetical protein CPY51_12510 [Rhizobium tubonense]|uniref:Uncharacterized protein n=1 Tax=Rhizobium tubonense TaxID=484088 RepID=A0A2W4D941_9HYPH|nr:hypothetical protein CPY51_12510 [Rhizobium tubonense]